MFIIILIHEFNLIKKTQKAQETTLKQMLDMQKLLRKEVIQVYVT